MLAELFASGRAADIAIGFMAVEAAILWLFGARLGLRMPGAALAAMLLAGLFLLLALRAALTGAGWPWIATFLVLALAAHAADLGQRLVRRRCASAGGGDAARPVMK